MNTSELLEPDTPDNAAHRKTKQVHLHVITPTPTDVIVKLFRQCVQRNSPKAVRKMGHQQRNIVLLQPPDQSPKKMRCIPETMD